VDRAVTGRYPRDFFGVGATERRARLLVRVKSIIIETKEKINIVLLHFAPKRGNRFLPLPSKQVQNILGGILIVKKLFPALLAVVLMLSLGASGYAVGESDLSPGFVKAPVYLDGLPLDADATVQSGIVYLPLRVVCEALGYTVGWSDQDNVKTVTVTGSEKTVSINLSTQEITNNGHTYYMSGSLGSSCILPYQRTYLDSVYFCENFPVRAYYNTELNMVTLSRAEENSISLTTMKLNSEDDGLTISLQYPQVGKLGDYEVQNIINAVLRHAAAKAVDEGLQNSFELTQARLDYPDQNLMCDTYLNYRVTYNRNNLLCVTLFDYQYAGGAHGSMVQTSYTFDLTTGDILELGDLLNDASSYLPFINSAIRTEIDNRVASGDLVEFDSARFETIGDQPAFYLSDDAIVFYFQQYEYFPYAAGIQEFFIPYSDLADLLDSGWNLTSLEPVTLDPAVMNLVPDGGTATVTLPGNATTGYTWHWEVGDPDVLAVILQTDTPDSDLIGAGASYTWLVQALNPGQTTLTFTYYRDWEEPSSTTAENTVVYQILVP
jgi:inhibitor of cysteine peptidase